MQAYIEDEVRPEDSAIVDYWSDIKSPGPVKDHLVPATMKEALEMLGLKKHVVFGEISAIRYVAASIQGFEYQVYRMKIYVKFSYGNFAHRNTQRQGRIRPLERSLSRKDLL